LTPPATAESRARPPERPGGRELLMQIRGWATELGFQQLGVSGIDLSEAEARLNEWLARGWHGTMSYMARHGARRSRPAELLPGTLSVISARMNYQTDRSRSSVDVLADPERAFVARYALGRDYHRLIRHRLRQLAARIEAETGAFVWRPFTDSAPVLEKPLASQAGLGWVGKHTNLINPRAGSWFLLGELYTDLDLPEDDPVADSHCGTCSRCISICPTGAIVAPYQLDARRCISYLTIELHGSIPVELRGLIGNRVFGCDDCQLVCPWNRFAQMSAEPDFQPRNGLDEARLLELFAWTEEEFLRRMEGSPIRRIGFARWSRNLAVALGNGPDTPLVRAALTRRLDDPSQLVVEHVQWALQEITQR
jgi:epoxyqueuosine reductase